MTVSTIATFIIILTEKMHRSIVAMMGVVLMVLAGMCFGFYTEEEAILSVEFYALGFLLCMRILISLLEPTGFFQYAEIRARQLSKGKPQDDVF